MILRVPNVSKNSYHDTRSDQLYAQHDIGHVRVVWVHIVSNHGAATA